jgi:aldose 1-epimerase
MRHMRKCTLLLLAISLLLGVLNAKTMSAFTARQISIDGVPVVQLTDAKREIRVSILPSLGNTAYEMSVHGKNILVFPDVRLSDFIKKPMQTGIPFMAPWANRIDDTGFWANGKKYGFDMASDIIRKDQRGLPIHGLLSASTSWQVMDIGADQRSAYVTSKFEFWKYPELIAQWPFAHEYEMTYRLADGALEVRTTVSNLCAEAMPLAIGFHPYYRIPDIPRDQWIVRIPARKSVVADDRRIPTGEFKPMALPKPLPLKGRTLDDGFIDLERDAAGCAQFSIEAGERQIELLFGPGFPVAVIWNPESPPGQSWEFICIEPMTCITNGISLNHAGKYPELQTVPARSKWTGSFWIRAKGF